MEHTHQYDEQGKQMCCTEEAKINNTADALIKNSPMKSCSCSGDDQDQHTNDDSHDHDHASEDGNNIRLFLPAALSFVALLIAIALDNYFPQTWFTG
jgi:Cd2+/Zn2+-exporting ATPase